MLAAKPHLLAMSTTWSKQGMEAQVERCEKSSLDIKLKTAEFVPHSSFRNLLYLKKEKKIAVNIQS